MEFSERISAVMRHYNLSPKEMAEKCGVQRTAVTHILNGRNRPSVSFLEQLSGAFPELNTRWLLHGKGLMFTSVTETTAQAHPTSQTREKEQPIVEATSKRPVTNVETNVTTGEEQAPLPQEFVKRMSDGRCQPERIVFFYSDGTFEQFTLPQE